MKKKLRGKVAKYLPKWKEWIKEYGANAAAKLLKSGRTYDVSHKDRFQLLKVLGLYRRSV